MHLNGSLKLNLPFYLLKSLQEMVTWVQAHPEHTTRSIYHQGLIKLLLISQLNKEGRTWESFLLELGFEKKTKEKGKRVTEDLNQQTKNHEEQIEHIATEGKGFVEKPNQNKLFPEALVTDENPETLSMVLKNITSNNEERVQVLNLEGIGFKPRTTLRSKMQVEMELVHIPKNRN